MLTKNNILKKLVVLTGAGISAESGLKTFRDSDGLWEGYNIEDVATYNAWLKNPTLVLDFYNERRKSVLKSQPNAAHQILAELQEVFDVHIVTQNVDDLHERAGSKKILHLHGEILKMKSTNNENKFYSIETDIYLGDKAEDGFQLRPHIVWFGEQVPMMDKAIINCMEAEIFVVIGTSLAVYPAAGLINYVSYETPKFIIDKKIPNIAGVQNINLFENTAIEGMKLLREKLLSEYL